MMARWIALCLCSTVFVTLMLLICYVLPFSKFFRMLHSYESLYAKVERDVHVRSDTAREYFNKMDAASSSGLYAERMKLGNISFSIGLITIKRVKKFTKKTENIEYLLQSASLLDRMMKHYRVFQHAVPFICNVDSVPGNHEGAVSLYSFMPYVERYGSASSGFNSGHIPGTNKTFSDVTQHITKYAKETYDYTFCMLSAAALRPQHVILIEDDALPHRDFPVVLEHLMNSRLKNIYGESYSNVFSFIKFYFPAKWQGYSFESITIVDLISVSLVGASAASVIRFLCSYKNRYSLNYSHRRMFFLTFVVIMLGSWITGRQNVNEFRRLSKHLYRLQSSEGCCTQAMLYPAGIIPSLSAYLVGVPPHMHTDLAVMDFVEVNGLPGLQLEPNLFHHTGLVSTLDSQKHPEEFLFHL